MLPCVVLSRAGKPCTVDLPELRKHAWLLIDGLGSKKQEKSLVGAINQPVNVESTSLISSVINTMDNSTHQKVSFTLMLTS